MFSLVGFPLFFLAVLYPWPGAHAVLTNITIDDTNSTFWTWAGSWNAVTPTTPCGCFAQPDPGLVYNSTWHDGLLRSGSFAFQGSAVYIYGIDVVNPANISFAMNNPSKTGFHYYGGAGYVYNSLFFSATNLDSKVQHTVTWIMEISSTGGGAGLFDYAVVTLDQAADSSSLSSASSTDSAGGSLGPSPSLSSSSVSATSAGSSGGPVVATTTHKSKTGAIVGAVVGVVGGLAIVGALIFLWRRRNSTTSGNDTAYYPPAARSTDPTSPTMGPSTSRAMFVEPYPAAPASTSGATGYSIEPYQLPGSASGPRTPMSSPSQRSEDPFTMATVSPAPVSTYASSETRREPVGLAWDGQQQPSHAGRPLDVEARLKQLEEFAASSRPPAYS
ncbi:hypothetical protein B0H19DRAFT_1153255 [Mycena capillaripes]|nr:hypothetical protein B0H19DRAFT_1153255 [Mycena capillaripes]